VKTSLKRAGIQKADNFIKFETRFVINIIQEIILHHFTDSNRLKFIKINFAKFENQT